MNEQNVECTHGEIAGTRAGCHSHRQGRPGLFFALATIGTGLVFLLEHLGMLGGYAAWQLWPLYLVLAGLMRLVSGVYVHSGRWIFGLVLLGAGGVALAHTTGVAGASWPLIWPASLVVLGVILIGVVVFRVRRPPKRFERSSEGYQRVVLSGRQETCADQEFTEARLEAVLGSYELDLRNARIVGGEAHIYARVVMGGIVLRVSPSWCVRVIGNPVMGSVESKLCSSGEASGPLLLVHADVVMGSIELKN